MAKASVLSQQHYDTIVMNFPLQADVTSHSKHCMKETMASRRPPFEITDYADGRTYIHTRVELLYRYLVEELDREYPDDETLFEAHVQVIIWGVLYIEGLLNHKLLAFTGKAFRRAELVDSYWELVKQAKIKDKIDVVLSIDGARRPWLKECKKQFLTMVEERNRLVHFKEKPTPMDLKAFVATLGPDASSRLWSDNAPFPKIVADLLATSLTHRIQLVRNLGDEIDRVRT